MYIVNYPNINMSIFLIMCSSIVTLVLLYLLYPVSFKLGLIDSPGGRKIHKKSAVLIGGLAMVLGIACGILTGFPDSIFAIYFVLVLVITAFVGMIDDIYSVSVSIRLLFQVLIGVLVVISGITIESFGYILGGEEVLLYGWSVFITVIAIVGSINAVNFSDGIDGLAASLSIVTLLAIAFFSLNKGSEKLFYFSLIFISVLVPFLFANFGLILKKRKVFMGDSGSTMLGLGLAWLLIVSSQSELSLFSPVTALWIFAVPLIDSISTILLRTLHGRSPFKADNQHLHHLLRLFGFGDKMVLVIIVSLAASFAILGIYMELNLVKEWVMFLVFLTIFLTYFLFSLSFWRVLKS